MWFSSYLLQGLFNKEKRHGWHHRSRQTSRTEFAIGHDVIQADMEIVDMIVSKLNDEKDHTDFFESLLNDLPLMDPSLIGHIFSAKLVNQINQFGSRFGAIVVTKFSENQEVAGQAVSVLSADQKAILRSLDKLATSARVPWVYILGYRAASQISAWLGQNTSRDTVATAARIGCRILEDYVQPNETAKMEISNGILSTLTPNPSDGLSLLLPMYPDSNIGNVVADNKATWSKRAQYLQNLWKITDTRILDQNDDANRNAERIFKKDLVHVHEEFLSVFVQSLLHDLQYDAEQLQRVRVTTRYVLHHFLRWSSLSEAQIAAAFVRPVQTFPGGNFIDSSLNHRPFLEAFYGSFSPLRESSGSQVPSLTLQRDELHRNLSILAEIAPDKRHSCSTAIHILNQCENVTMVRTLLLDWIFWYNLTILSAKAA